MIQDIYPRVYRNEYQNIKPECGDFVLIFFENTALIRLQDGRLRYPSFEETRELSCDYHYLFSIDNFRYFLACTRIRLQEAAAINGYHYENVSIFRTALSRHTAFAGMNQTGSAADADARCGPTARNECFCALTAATWFIPGSLLP